MSEYSFEEERQPFGDFDYWDEYPTDGMLQNYREENDYQNDGNTDEDEEIDLECHCADGGCHC